MWFLADSFSGFWYFEQANTHLLIFFGSLYLCRKIDGPRAPRDERRRAQHNEGEQMHSIYSSEHVSFQWKQEHLTIGKWELRGQCHKLNQWHKNEIFQYKFLKPKILLAINFTENLSKHVGPDLHPIVVN